MRVQIVGATGYGGLGMVELLLGHPHVEIVSLVAKTDTGRPLSDFFPHLRGFCDRVVDEVTDDNVGQGADLVIFATPDGVGMGHAARLLEQGKAVLDYSGDFRFSDVERYGRYARFHPSLRGRPHACPDLLPSSVYGVPELHRDRLHGARLVGNPGCFAVSMLLGLAPAVRARLIDPSSVISDGKTGSSGAGKKPNAAHHYPERNENLTPYRVAVHQHLVETVEELSLLGAGRVGLTFVPHLVPLTRGIICTMYATLARDVGLEEVHALYCDAYAGERFVRVLPLGAQASQKHVVGSNLCDISLAVDAENRRLVVVSAIDNLLKGQAGNAVQNLNVMFGFPEDAGLGRIPMYP